MLDKLKKIRYKKKGMIIQNFIITLGAILFQLNPLINISTTFKNANHEIIYIIYNDNSLLKKTSDLKTTIDFDLRTLTNIDKIQYIIHNHLNKPEFSPADKWIYKYLIQRGFEGKFLLCYKGNIYQLTKDDLFLK